MVRLQGAEGHREVGSQCGGFTAQTSLCSCTCPASSCYPGNPREHGSWVTGATRGPEVTNEYVSSPVRLLNQACWARRKETPVRRTATGVPESPGGRGRHQTQLVSSCYSKVTFCVTASLATPLASHPVHVTPAPRHVLSPRRLSKRPPPRVENVRLKAKGTACNHCFLVKNVVSHWVTA